MNITKTTENGKLILAAQGNLDTTTSLEFQTALTAALEEAKEIVIDFTELEYISSAGLRVLMIGQNAADEKGGSITIRGANEEVMEVFEMTGLSEELNIV